MSDQFTLDTRKLEDDIRNILDTTVQLEQIPEGTLQRREELDIHILTRQLLGASVIFGLPLNTPKVPPIIVAIKDADDGIVEICLTASSVFPESS